MFCFRAFFRACLLLAFAYTGAVQAASTFNLATGTGGGTATEYTWASPVLTVNNGADITITGTASGSTRIVVASGATADITLNGVSIDVSAIANTAAFDMTGATVNLTLQGSNTLKSGNRCAGLQAPSGATLTIDGTGSLSATGGQWGAGIGGGSGGSGGTITINGGTVTATGGFGGAGIGGGNGGAGGNISIHGGTVNATGGGGVASALSGAGIGGGGGGVGGTIKINGNANVTATGGNAISGNIGGGAGIGSGGSVNATRYSAGTIVIDLRDGAQVTPQGGSGTGTGGNGAAIGESGYVGGDGSGIASVTNPTNLTRTVGDNAAFSCSASAAGAPIITYQDWFTGGTGAWSNLGSPGNTYTKASVALGDSGSQYACQILASGGSMVGNGSITYYSKPATLTVNARNATVSVPTTGGGVLIALAVLLAVLGIRGQCRVGKGC